MMELIGARPGELALDLGCGGGHAAFRLAPLAAHVIACDLSADMLGVATREAARRGLGNLTACRARAETLPFADHCFDVAVSRFSAHHWRDFAAGLAEVRRVLKPGGLAVFMDVVSPGPALPDTWLQTLELLRDPSHVRDHSLDEWRESLGRAGFEPAPADTFRLRLEFDDWTGRMGVPADRALAIRSLQKQACAEVADHFAFGEDGSFTVDTMLIAAR
ncbi:S-adenosyl-L-methionine (SAM)-dependent methyltransferase PhcB [Paludibacterium paludis]|uniref:S-adenosyl-L-methionine (SAM)-dependent methyltransferase PhcB n=2 Tax=Paludibacterium paludis TaxID=1225769 RepID=A0A918P6D0_9NEIS|nr:S-adenosyl-L-methionine (SAM)-dependent methyltransferase PhcB [Paludibacterium paludis]